MGNNRFESLGSKALDRKPWIDRLALRCQNREHARVNPPERFAGDEALQGLIAESELAKGEIAFASETPLAKQHVR
jgi:hypothetical protein